jgi:hypothetical protein
MPHSSLVAFQVFTAILAALFYLLFVAMEWLVVRFVLASSDDDNADYSTLFKYISWKEYTLGVGKCLSILLSLSPL